MNAPIPANIVVEDELSEAVLRRLLEECGGPWSVNTVYSRGGAGYILRNLRGFNAAAQAVPFIVLLDLDHADCAPLQLAKLLPHGPAANMVLRFAVREVEAWLLADANALASYLGVPGAAMPAEVDSLSDPKRALVRAASRSPRRGILDDVVPPKRSTAIVGRDYNARLSKFVVSTWRPELARSQSDSLDRAMTALEQFVPDWT